MNAFRNMPSWLSSRRSESKSAAVTSEKQPLGGVEPPPPTAATATRPRTTVATTVAANSSATVLPSISTAASIPVSTAAAATSARLDAAGWSSQRAALTAQQTGWPLPPPSSRSTFRATSTAATAATTTASNAASIVTTNNYTEKFKHDLLARLAQPDHPLEKCTTKALPGGGSGGGNGRHPGNPSAMKVMAKPDPSTANKHVNAVGGAIVQTKPARAVRRTNCCTSEQADLLRKALVDLMASTSRHLFEFENINIAAAEAAYHLPCLKPFIERIVTDTRLPLHTLCTALLYMLRLKNRHPHLLGNYGTAHRLALTSLILANKYVDDDSFTLPTWYRVTRRWFSHNDLISLEAEFLAKVEFRLEVLRHRWSEFIQDVERHLHAWRERECIERTRWPSLAQAIGLWEAAEQERPWQSVFESQSVRAAVPMARHRAPSATTIAATTITTTASNGSATACHSGRGTHGTGIDVAPITYRPHLNLLPAPRPITSAADRMRQSAGAKRPDFTAASRLPRATLPTLWTSASTSAIPTSASAAVSTSATSLVSSLNLSSDNLPIHSHTHRHHHHHHQQQQPPHYYQQLPYSHHHPLHHSHHHQHRCHPSVTAGTASGASTPGSTGRQKTPIPSQFANAVAMLAHPGGVHKFKRALRLARHRSAPGPLRSCYQAGDPTAVDTASADVTTAAAPLTADSFNGMDAAAIATAGGGPMATQPTLPLPSLPAICLPPNTLLSASSRSSSASSLISLSTSSSRTAVEQIPCAAGSTIDGGGKPALDSLPATVEPDVRWISQPFSLMHRNAGASADNTPYTQPQLTSNHKVLNQLRALQQSPSNYTRTTSASLPLP